MKNKNTISPYQHVIQLALCAAIFAINPARVVHAQDWRVEPIVKAGLVTDDNARLSTRTDEEVELTGYLMDARADIYFSSDTTTFFFQPRALLRNYPDDQEFDSDDFFLRSKFRHKGETSTFGFRINFDQQSVRTGERTDSNLNADDPDEIPDDDTGLVGLDGDRSRWRLSPYWDYRLSDVSSIGIAIDYFDTRYDDVFAGLLDDFTDSRVNLKYRRTLSNTTTGTLTLTGRRFEPNGLSDDNTGYGAMAGIEHALTEKTQLTAMVGVEITEQSMGQSDSNVVGNITVQRNLKIIKVLARYQRAVTANGSGVVEVRDIVNMSLNRRLNEKISAGLGVRAYHAESVSGAISATERNYVQLQAKFNWYLSEAFVIQADYRYNILDRRNAIGGRSNSNEVGLWLIYQPNTIPTL